MISRKIFAGGLACLALAAGTFSAGDADAQAQLRQRSQPAPNPGTNLEQGPLPAGHERTTCKGVQVYVTLRGVAFACADYQQGTFLTMVLDNRQFADIETVAMPVLMDAARESRPYILDPQKQGTQLKVRHRAAGERAQGICDLVSTGIGSEKCREVVHLYR